MRLLMRQIYDLDHTYYLLINQIANCFLFFTEGLRPEIILKMAKVIPASKLFDKVFELVENLTLKSNAAFQKRLQDAVNHCCHLHLCDKTRQTHSKSKIKSDFIQNYLIEKDPH